MSNPSRRKPRKDNLPEGLLVHIPPSSVLPVLERMDRERFVNSEEAAKFLGVTCRYLKDLARAGAIPAHPLGTGAVRKMWRFRLSELEQAIARPSSDLQLRTGAVGQQQQTFEVGQ